MLDESLWAAYLEYSIARAKSIFSSRHDFSEYSILLSAFCIYVLSIHQSLILSFVIIFSMLLASIVI